MAQILVLVDNNELNNKKNVKDNNYDPRSRQTSYYRFIIHINIDEEFLSSKVDEVTLKTFNKYQLNYSVALVAISGTYLLPPV